MPYTEAQQIEKLKKIHDKILKAKEAPLYADRTENNYIPVTGEGSHNAAIMFVGEAPGKNEAVSGRPFCGSAGKILDSLLASVHIPREEVYITNIVKDRPPKNRDPFPEEIEYYGPFLDQQIAIIQPKVIATLGRFSMVYIMNKLGLEDKVEPISVAHGKVYKATTSYGEVHIVPLYHPAASIYNQKLKETLKEDFKVLTKFTK
jgi:uracil-DNA glycosylase